MACLWTKNLTNNGQLESESKNSNWSDDTPSDDPWTPSDDPESPYVIG